MTRSILFLAVLLIPWTGYSQRNCGTPAYTEGVINNNRALTGRYGGSIGEDTVRALIGTFTEEIIIPIAFHIVYHTDAQKISRAVIDQQVNALNDDFAGRSALIERIPASYRDRVADCRIRFVVDTVFYSPTATEQFRLHAGSYRPKYEGIKFSAFGGHNALPSTEYLNVWVGNITDGSTRQLLGYATFPGGDNRFDGVVIYYKAFGVQNAMPQYNKGRTLTHETGHWLNLKHISGDTHCGDDLVGDTPMQDSQNVACPVCPHISCASGPDGDMLMNYMDYVNDTCMFMFTKGQKERMRSIFLEYGSRASFIHGVDENNMILAANNRSDSSTSTITTITEAGSATRINWDTVSNAAQYKVLAKKVEDTSWTEITTTNSQVTLGGLKKGQLYEVKVQTILQNGIAAPESAPYLFTANRQAPIGRKLRIK